MCVCADVCFVIELELEVVVVWLLLVCVDVLLVVCRAPLPYLCCVEAAAWHDLPPAIKRERATNPVGVPLFAFPSRRPPLPLPPPVGAPPQNDG